MYFWDNDNNNNDDNNENKQWYEPIYLVPIKTKKLHDFYSHTQNAEPFYCSECTINSVYTSSNKGKMYMSCDSVRIIII